MWYVLNTLPVLKYRKKTRILSLVIPHLYWSFPSIVLVNLNYLGRYYSLFLCISSTKKFSSLRYITNKLMIENIHVHVNFYKSYKQHDPQGKGCKYNSVAEKEGNLHQKFKLYSPGAWIMHGYSHLGEI